MNTMPYTRLVGNERFARKAFFGGMLNQSYIQVGVACPNFHGDNFVGSPQTAKFVEVFSLKKFPAIQ